MGAVVQFDQGDDIERSPVADDVIAYLPVEPGADRPAGLAGELAVVGYERCKRTCGKT